MYTMVMMMALSGSADTASFGGLFKRGGSSCGGGCSGVVVTPAVGCHGSVPMMGCHGSVPMTGCHGAVAPAAGCSGEAKSGFLGFGLCGKKKAAASGCCGVPAPVVYAPVCPQVCPAPIVCAPVCPEACPLVPAPSYAMPIDCAPVVTMPGVPAGPAVMPSTPAVKPEPAKMPEVKKNEPSTGTPKNEPSPPKVEEKKNEGI